nr:BRO family protein [Citrobacter sp. Res13-Sevr-PEB04-36]
MLSKNSEAQQCANTNRASMSETVCKETNMNIVAKSDYNFHGVNLVPVENKQGVWFTSSDLASALEYSNSRAVTMIYNKYADEFSDGMTQVLEVSTSGNYRKKVRVFSLRGAHLIAMFARTDVAKEFRRWVLDILDREVQDSPIAKQFSDEELVSLCYLQLWMEKSQQISKKLYPAMRELGSELSGKLRDIAHETRYMTDETKKLLLRETQNLDNSNFVVSRAQPVLAKLRGEEGWIH